MNTNGLSVLLQLQNTGNILYCLLDFSLLTVFSFFLQHFFVRFTIYLWDALCLSFSKWDGDQPTDNRQKRKRTDEGQWDRQQKPNICSQQSRGSAPLRDTLSSKPPTVLIPPPPIKAAPHRSTDGPAQPLSAGWGCFSDLHFIDASHTHPLVCLLISSSFRLLSSHFETQHLHCFDSLFNSSACLSFLSSTQVYTIIPALMKWLTTQPALKASIQGRLWLCQRLAFRAWRGICAPFLLSY